MAIDIEAANREALERLCRARPAWTGITTAREALGLMGRALLHAGPPITWSRMCPIMRGAVMCAAQFEGWAATPAEAERQAAAGEIEKSYSTKKRRVKGTKTENPREMPVHPTLAKILATWKLSGFEQLTGRKPRTLVATLPAA